MATMESDEAPEPLKLRTWLNMGMLKPTLTTVEAYTLKPWNLAVWNFQSGNLAGSLALFPDSNIFHDRHDLWGSDYRSSWESDDVGCFPPWTSIRSSETGPKDDLMHCKAIQAILHLRAKVEDETMEPEPPQNHGSKRWTSNVSKHHFVLGHWFSKDIHVFFSGTREDNWFLHWPFSRLGVHSKRENHKTTIRWIWKRKFRNVSLMKPWTYFQFSRDFERLQPPQASKCPPLLGTQTRSKRDAKTGVCSKSGTCQHGCLRSLGLSERSHFFWCIMFQQTHWWPNQYPLLRPILDKYKPWFNEKKQFFPPPSYYQPGSSCFFQSPLWQY